MKVFVKKANQYKMLKKNVNGSNDGPQQISKFITNKH